MVRMIFVWVCLSIAMGLSITQIRHMTGKQMWSVTKTIAFGVTSATVALFVLILIVILF